MNSLVVFVRRSAFALLLAAAPLVGLGGPLSQVGVAHADSVSSIVVRGNARIETATIRNYVSIKPGKSFSAADIDESVKALYDTGLFADVRINRAGSSLVVAVVENPIVNTVIFRGNKKIKSNILAGVVQTDARGVLTDAKLQADVQRIKDYYTVQGRSAADVHSEVTKLPNDRVDVVFVIAEGKRTGIGSITFVGNHAFSDAHLRSVIISRQHNFLSWLNKKDIYDESKLVGDQESLRRFYMSHGYADFRVVSVDHTFDEAKGRYFITYTIEEGDRYRFSAINIDSSIPGVSGASLKSVVKTRSGNVFNATDVEKSLENLSIEVAREGYAFAQVRPRGDRDYEHHTIALTYLIDEGPRAYIERINIIGNTKTRDYVIRREFDVSEGDAYNRVLIDRAQRKLQDLGYFKSVSITTEPGSAPDRVIVDVNVEDQSTGDFSVGAGYATDGLIGEVSLNEKNFLGRGQQLKISVGYGQHQKNYSLSFTDPYFLGKHVSAGFDFYGNSVAMAGARPYDTRTIGGGLRMGLPITDDLNIQFNYKASQEKISNTAAATALYFPNGTTLTSSLGYVLSYSTLDSYTNPHDGVRATFTQDFAGLGGDVQYVRSVAQAQYFRSLVDDADIVGEIKLQGGNITGLGAPVRVADNFFKGGETIRGFASYGYGPRETTSTTNTPVGGKNFWAATAEVQFPMLGVPPEMGFRGAVFADAGQLWGVDVPVGGVVTTNNTLRSSVGASVLWASPIGILRGDFAYPITKDPTDQTQIFRFSAGKQF